MVDIAEIVYIIMVNISFFFYDLYM